MEGAPWLCYHPEEGERTGPSGEKVKERQKRSSLSYPVCGHRHKITEQCGLLPGKRSVLLIMNLIQQKAAFYSSKQCSFSLSSFCHEFLFSETYSGFTEMKVNKKMGFPTPTPCPAEIGYNIIANLNSVPREAVYTLHANGKTALPQEWSLLRLEVRRNCMLSSEQPQEVQQDVHQLRESRSGITAAAQWASQLCQFTRRGIASASVRTLALTLLPKRRHFQMQEANMKLAVGRFVFYTVKTFRPAWGLLCGNRNSCLLSSWHWASVYHPSSAAWKHHVTPHPQKDWFTQKWINLDLWVQAAESTQQLVPTVLRCAQSHIINYSALLVPSHLCAGGKGIQMH